MRANCNDNDSLTQLSALTLLQLDCVRISWGIPPVLIISINNLVIDPSKSLFANTVLIFFIQKSKFKLKCKSISTSSWWGLAALYFFPWCCLTCICFASLSKPSSRFYWKLPWHTWYRLWCRHPRDLKSEKKRSLPSRCSNWISVLQFATM